MKIKLSVITPNYNGEKHLEDMLNSVSKAVKFAKAEKIFEHVVVDDCSNDSSREIIKKYKDSVSYKVTSKKNRKNSGLGITRNNGFAVSTGEYVWHMDSDDMILEDSIKEILEKLTKNPPLIKLEFKKFPIERPKFRYHFKIAKNRKKYLYTVGQWPLASVWNREFWIKSEAKFFPKNGDTGAYLAISKIKNINDVIWIDKPMFNYRSTEGSMSTAFKSFLGVYERLCGYLEEVFEQINNKEFLKIKRKSLYNEFVEYILTLRYLGLFTKEKQQQIKRLNGKKRFFMILTITPKWLNNIIFKYAVMKSMGWTKEDLGK